MDGWAVYNCRLRLTRPMLTSDNRMESNAIAPDRAEMRVTRAHVGAIEVRVPGR